MQATTNKFSENRNRDGAVDNKKITKDDLSSEAIAILERYYILDRDEGDTISMPTSDLHLELATLGLLMPEPIDSSIGKQIKRYHITDEGKRVLQQ
jgi:hypothetical protein